MNMIIAMRRRMNANEIYLTSQKGSFFGLAADMGQYLQQEKKV
jgi:hypothetical protein